MNDKQFAEFAAWITQAGLAGAAREKWTLLTGFSERMRDAIGLAAPQRASLIDRYTCIQSMRGEMFPWRTGGPAGRSRSPTAPTSQGEALAQPWQRSPFYHMLQNERGLGHAPAHPRPEPDRAAFSMLADMHKGRHDGDGRHDLPALPAEGAIGEMDCVYSYWSTDRERRGFHDAGDIADLERLLPMLALAVKATSLTRIARTLVETYLGRDAGRRVLSGSIGRGIADRIEAALWFSDLHK